MTIRMYKSDPKFKELDFLLTMRARFMNAAVFYDLKDIPLEFRLDDIESLDFAIGMVFFLLSHNVKEEDWTE